MGKRGPRPMPVEIQKQNGTYRRDRHGSGVTLAARIARLEKLAPPKHLAKAKAYRDAWLELTEPIVDSGVLTESDLGALEMMVVSLVEFREADTLVREQGMFVERIFATTKDGEPIYRDEPHPALKVRDKAAAEFRAWAARFGLTPADRASLGLAHVQGRTMAHSLESRIGRSPRARNVIDADA